MRAGSGGQSDEQDHSCGDQAGRVRHCGAFPMLEDELCGLMAGGKYEGPGRSPDRADALVWAMTELMLGKRKLPKVWVF